MLGVDSGGSPLMPESPRGAGTPENGDRGTIYIENNQDAGVKMAEILEASKSSGDVLGASFEGNLKTFADVWAATNRKDSTIYTAVHYLMNMGKALGGKDPAEWTESDFQSFMLSPSYVDWAPSTKQTARSFLKAYLTVLGRHEMLPPNLYHFWKAKSAYGGGSNRYDAMKAKVPSVSEVDRVLKACRDSILTDDEPIIHVYRHMALFLAAAYGLRSIEVAQLRVCDIDLEKGCVHIEKSKGDKSRDVYMDVPITPEMWDCFMAARSSLIDRLRVGDGEGHFDTNLNSLSDRAAPLFFKRVSDNGSVGDPLSPMNVGNIYSRLGDRIVGRHINPHAYRHAKAFRLLEVDGIEPHQAMLYLGHSTLDQTLAYVYAGVEEQRAAFAAVGVAPVTPEPSVAAPDYAAKVKVLAELNAQGILADSAFAAAVAALGG